MQVPGVPARAHDAQVPAQAVEQQTPWAQSPESHSLAAPHGCPTGLPPQLPPMHVLGDMQSPSVLHVVLQALVAASQVNGLQGEVVTVRQVPAPSQVRGGVSTEPVQLPAPQTVPPAYNRQLPLPAQRPSVPQEATPVSVHWLATAGG